MMYQEKSIYSDLAVLIGLSINGEIEHIYNYKGGFSNAIAYKGLLKDDIVYATGCIYRVISCLTQVLYALNETYLMNEKGALAAIDTFEIAPKKFKRSVENIVCSSTIDSVNMKNVTEQLSGIVKEVEELCRHIYNFLCLMVEY